MSAKIWALEKVTRENTAILSKLQALKNLLRQIIEISQTKTGEFKEEPT